MRLFNWHVPGTRDLQREVEQLQKQIELLQKERQLNDEISRNLRTQNHQLRMDLGKAHQMLDEWMGHYDALRRDMQQRLEQSVQIKLKLEEKGEHFDPVAQMRELRDQLRPEKGQQADRKNTLARDALERLAQEGGDSLKEKKGQEAEQTRKPREKAKGMEVSL